MTYPCNCYVCRENFETSWFLGELIPTSCEICGVPIRTNYTKKKDKNNFRTDHFGEHIGKNLRSFFSWLREKKQIDEKLFDHIEKTEEYPNSFLKTLLMHAINDKRISRLEFMRLIVELLPKLPNEDIFLKEVQQDLLFALNEREFNIQNKTDQQYYWTTRYAILKFNLLFEKL